MKLQVSRIMAPSIMALAMFTARLATADDDFSQGAGPTFTSDVAPIFVKNCVACHRPGESAPMTLTSYAEARPWAKSIKKSVESRDMPPWDANPAHGKFSNDISLSDIEIATIVKWVDEGAPQGDPARMPALPKFTEGWQLGEPDYIIELDEFEVPADGPDRFPNLQAKIVLPEDKWIRAVEVRPGNPKVAHHLVAFVTNLSGMASAGGLGSAIAGWAAGMPPIVYPEGMGRKVKKNTDLMVNMHYHPYGQAAKDRTRIGLYFGQGDLRKEVGAGMATDFLLRIPPRAENHEVRASYTFRQDSQISALAPHMHLRGKDMRFTAVYPDGRSEILLDVPKYDFNWQWRYIPEKPLAAPKGTRIDVVAHFDNSAKNPNNPNPDEELTFGEESSDEMMIGAVEYYVDNGVSPPPINLGEVIDKILKDNPSDYAYRVNLNAGFMNFPTVLVLPPDGLAAWYFPLGEQAITLPVSDVKWDGSNFTMTMEMLGRGALKVQGTIGSDGSISGKFDAESLQLDKGGPTSMFQMVGFTGKLATVKQVSQAN